MKSQNFTGTFGGGGGQNVFSSTSQQRDDPFGGGTPAPKPNYARRLGTSLMGGIANPALRSSGNDPSFSSINLPTLAAKPPQEQFGPIGERAGDQEVANWNKSVADFNATAKANKEQEIADYESEVSRLNSQYASAVNNYNSQVNKHNTTRDSVAHVNRLADSVNAKAAIFRSAPTSQAKADYEQALSFYNSAKNSLSSNALLKGVDGLFDDGGKKIVYDNAQTAGNRLSNNANPYNFSAYGGPSGTWYGGVSVQHRDKLEANNKQYYTRGYNGIYHGADLWNAYRGAGGPTNYQSGSVYNSQPGFYSVYGYYNQPAYNPWSNQVFQAKERVQVNADGKAAINVPYVFGQYDSSADQYGAWYDPPKVAPTRPTMPDAPDPIYEQRQVRDELPDVIERRLGPGQREAVGDLPSQESTTSGDTFGVSEVNHDGIEYRELEQINQAERQRLGAPVAYRTASGVFPFGGSWGGDIIRASDITNVNSTHYYIPGLGWISKSGLTPLYN